MISAISNARTTSSSLSEKLRQIKIMKWILDYCSESEFSYENLHMQMASFCMKNTTHLVIIHHYLTQIPTVMKEHIDKIISAKDNLELCKKLYFKYIKNFHRIPEFEEYEMYIFIQRSEEVLSDFHAINKNNIGQCIEEIKNVATKQKSAQVGLLFSILNDKDRNLLVKGDIMQNLPQLLYWIQQNKNKPIEPLSNDDCEILAGLIYNLSYDEMLDKLNVSSSVKNYSDIHKIINKLPNKFHVQNITQVIFRILLIKPYIWRQYEHKLIVKSIKGLNNVSK